MRNYSIYFFAAMVLLVQSSCQKNFLDKTPDEDLTIDSLFTNHDYAQAALTSVYNSLPEDEVSISGNGGPTSPFGSMAYTAASDEMEMPWPEKYSQEMIAGAWNPSDGPVLTYWNNFYSGIRKANLFLENVSKVPMDASEKSRWVGEATYLRAFLYFNLIRMFGPVPIIDHTLTTGEDFKAYTRTPIDQCVDFITADCDKADSLLPMNYTPDQYGRATRAAALALKSRALLYMASPLWNGNPDYANVVDSKGIHLFPAENSPVRWQQAADAAKQCIDQCEAAGYKLYRAANNDPMRSFDELFLNDWNSEVLFARNEGVISDLDRSAFPHGMGGWSGYSPTQELVDAYQMADGSDPITGYNSDGSPVINPLSGYVETGFAGTGGAYWRPGIRNMYVNREPRFYASINYNGVYWAGRTLQLWVSGIDGLASAGRDHCVTGYLMRKLVDSTINPAQNKYSVRTWIYYRLGEQYLNYAEALNEASGPVADVYKYVDAIRDRAGLPGLPAGLSQGDMREKIRHERRIELAFEMHRYFDCHRWKISTTTDNGQMHGMNINTGSSLTDEAYYQRIVSSNRIFIGPKHYLWPIPQSEVNKNPNLLQNPGW